MVLASPLARLLAEISNLADLLGGRRNNKIVSGVDRSPKGIVVERKQSTQGQKQSLGGRAVVRQRRTS